MTVRADWIYDTFVRCLTRMLVHMQISEINDCNRKVIIKPNPGALLVHLCISLCPTELV